MKTKVLSNIIKILFILLFSLNFIGCASVKSLVPIENDQIRQDLGFNTILILDLEIEDHASLLSTYGSPSIWDFYRGNVQKENRMTQHIFSAPWNQSNQSYVLHTMQNLETLAGTHKISTISFSNSGYIYRYEIMRQFELISDSINYLGKIKITVNKDNTYTTELINDDISYEKSLVNFKRENPALYKKYESKIAIARTKKITDLTWDQ